MSDLGNQRRMAAAILKCGVNRVWYDPERQADIDAAISRKDLLDIIGAGAIPANTLKGNIPFLIHTPYPPRLLSISYAVFFFKRKNNYFLCTI